jgi:hypothetical protein
MSTILDKLMDYLIPVILSMMLVIALGAKPFVNFIQSHKVNKEAVLKLSTQLEDIKNQLNLYTTAVENLSGKDKVHFIAELEKVSNITDKNTELVSDLSKLVIKDPEKVLALKQLNMEVEVIKNNIIDIDNRVKKNDERIFGGLSFWVTLLLFALTIIIGVKVSIARAQ